MRLFIAILFNDEMKDALLKMQDDMSDRGVQGNFTPEDNMHLTLAFIGDYGNPERVLDAMERVEFRPIKISLNGVGSFGDLFWVGLADNPQLSGYVRRLRRELSEQGIPFDKKRFSPHITLIRKSSYKDGKPIPVSEPPKGSMVATGVSLMCSERGKNGMIYTEIGRVE